MILFHIKKHKPKKTRKPHQKKPGLFTLITVARNGRILSESSDFTVKSSAFTNIQSILSSIQQSKNVPKALVQDNTLLDGPLVYEVTPNDVKLVNVSPIKRVP